ncbi:lysophospholipid acyltransferase family protein [Pyruvatibacter sp.]|uniref:lysophospholipid acyltransferase family protein n=1 Tax=Pyruvatibacter sp. TaxID=1981328 RepID=UPI0032EF74F6
MATWRAVTRAFCFVAMTLVMMPFQWVLVKFNLPGSRRLPQIYHRLLCLVIGIRVTVKGKPVTDKPVLICANHTSYLDIPVMSTVTPVSFIAKSEVATWPLFGQMAKLQRTVFVERERRTKTREHRNQIHGRIVAGDTLILFPEGTSSDGNRVLPFKSALMSVAQMSVVGDDGALDDMVMVQPVSLAYTRVHGIPMGRYYRPYFAWYGDMDLVPHLWEVFQTGPIDVVMEYHDPVSITHAGTRKALATYCEAKVADGVARAISGRVAA